MGDPTLDRLTEALFGDGVTVPGPRLRRALTDGEAPMDPPEPDADTLAAYLGGRLEETERRAVRAWLAGSPEARETMLAAGERLASARPAATPPDLLQRALALVPEQAAAPAPPGWWARLTAWLPAPRYAMAGLAAGFAVALLAIVGTFDREAGKPEAVALNQPPPAAEAAKAVTEPEAPAAPAALPEPVPSIEPPAVLAEKAAAPLPAPAPARSFEMAERMRMESSRAMEAARMPAPPAEGSHMADVSRDGGGGMAPPSGARTYGLKSWSSAPPAAPAAAPPPVAASRAGPDPFSDLLAGRGVEVDVDAALSDLLRRHADAPDASTRRGIAEAVAVAVGGLNVEAVRDVGLTEALKGALAAAPPASVVARLAGGGRLVLDVEDAR